MLYGQLEDQQVASPTIFILAQTLTKAFVLLAPDELNNSTRFGVKQIFILWTNISTFEEVFFRLWWTGWNHTDNIQILDQSNIQTGVAIS